MPNLSGVMLILIGAAVALLVALIALQGGAPSGTATPPLATEPQTLIPPQIEGFEIERIDRADPIFEGELFSVHAALVPAANSPFAQSVESLGITVFLLKDPQAADEIKPLLLLGESRELTVEGLKAQAFASQESGLVGLLWQKDRKLYYVLVSGPTDEKADLDALHQAALAVAQAILDGGGQ